MGLLYNGTSSWDPQFVQPKNKKTVATGKWSLERMKTLLMLIMLLMMMLMLKKMMLKKEKYWQKLQMALKKDWKKMHVMVMKVLEMATTKRRKKKLKAVMK